MLPRCAGVLLLFGIFFLSTIGRIGCIWQAKGRGERLATKKHLLLDVERNA
jgi:hypothetical protein